MLSLVSSVVLGPAAPAQTLGGPLNAPSLPPTLPGGAALPNLPAGTQQEILQRLLDAGASRNPGAVAPAPTLRAPPPTPPISAPAAAIPDEPLSPVESFFAARLGTPLRQFGYDSFRNQGAANATGMGFGAVPEDYVIGRDDELDRKSVV